MAVSGVWTDSKGKGGLDVSVHDQEKKRGRSNNSQRSHRFGIQPGFQDSRRVLALITFQSDFLDLRNSILDSLCTTASQVLHCWGLGVWVDSQACESTVSCRRPQIARDCRMHHPLRTRAPARITGRHSSSAKSSSDINLNSQRSCRRSSPWQIRDTRMGVVHVYAAASLNESNCIHGPSMRSTVLARLCRSGLCVYKVCSGKSMLSIL